jgi:hypothetical protein
MRQIWKFPVEIADDVTIIMPRGAEVLYVGEQAAGLAIWALVDPDESLEERMFHIFGTGHSIPSIIEGRDHIATVPMRDGVFVWHVFDLQGSR